MRRILSALLSTGLLIGVLAIPAGAAGPRCVDLQSSDSTGLRDSRASYDGSLVGAQIYLAADQCRQATYTLYVLEDEGDTDPLAVSSVRGPADAGTPDAVEIFADADAADSDVCVYVESSIGRHVFDRAPAEGCVVLFDDGTSPGGGKGF